MSESEQEQDSSEVAQKIKEEANNHREFFYDPNLLDVDSRAEGEHYILTLIETDAPLDREEGYTWYYRYKNVENIPFEEIDHDSIEEYRLDRVEPDNDGDSKWKIVETNDFDDPDSFFEFVFK